MKKQLNWALGLVTLIGTGAALYLPHLDSYQTEGDLTLDALEQPVSVYRDSQNIPYLHGESLDDVLTAQGFVVAQDRLFQIEMMKYIAHGRLAELIGDKGLKMDRISRLINFRDLADHQAAIISAEERNYLERYMQGLNAYITGYAHEHPLVMGLMKIEATPWKLEDMLALQFFQVWSSSVNWRQELLTLELIDKLGMEQAAALAPLNINPDSEQASSLALSAIDTSNFSFSFDDSFAAEQRHQYGRGSNAWATGQQKSANGKPIMVNDPHIDTRRLPGFWYPMGLFTPEFRAVGAAPPGLPGLGVGRNQHIAWGATNGYSDSIDLYIERLNPANTDQYLEGDQVLALNQRKEVIRIKDVEAEGGYRSETMVIRSTKRGPLISDHGMTTSANRANRAVSLRWSVPEHLTPDAGNRELLIATSVGEAKAAIEKIATPLNHVVVDVAGNIARISSGFVPKRLRGDGLLPLEATEEDNWNGLIPGNEMPMEINPERDWVGSANHNVVPAGYPYAYSTNFSPAWRYRRLIELHEKPSINTEDHWDFLMDNKNLMAVSVTPLMIKSMAPEQAALAEILSAWDYMDTKEQVAPLIFQQIYRNYARALFEGRLGKELGEKFLNETYYHQERMIQRLMDNRSPWLDQTVDHSALLRDAASLAQQQLSEKYGSDASQWRWGQGHTVSFFHPLVPGHTAAKWLGGGVHEADGSVETLNRAAYKFTDPQHSSFIPSMRIVADMSDDDKVEAHTSGGISERLFNPSGKNQVDLWLNGQAGYWWFSEQAVKANTVKTVTLH